MGSSEREPGGRSMVKVDVNSGGQRSKASTTVTAMAGEA
jgi:hypothetical protein